jgi:VanZ family protein
LLLPTGLFRLPEGGFRRPAWCVAAAICVVLASAGMLDELTQPLVGRDCDPFDWAFDVAGAITTLTIVTFSLAVGAMWNWMRGAASTTGAG